MPSGLIKGDIVAIVMIIAACAVGVAAMIWLKVARDRKVPNPKRFEGGMDAVREAHGLSQRKAQDGPY